MLDEIPGVGPKRKKLLLSKYRTISNIAKESSETLSSTIGINQKLASQIILACRKFYTNQVDMASN